MNLLLVLCTQTLAVICVIETNRYVCVHSSTWHILMYSHCLCGTSIQQSLVGVCVCVQEGQGITHVYVDLSTVYYHTCVHDHRKKLHFCSYAVCVCSRSSSACYVSCMCVELTCQQQGGTMACCLVETDSYRTQTLPLL